MTKISKKSAYPVKDPVRKDYFVGTDSENNGKTVNFDFESTAKIISELNGNQVLNYRFRTDSNIDLGVLTEGVFLSAANETTVASISKLYINKSNSQETNISDLFRFVALNKEVFLIKLRNENNLNNALYLKITGATEYESYFTLDVAIYLGNATMPELLDYNIYFFDFELMSSGEALDLSLLESRITVLENQTDTDNVFVEMQNFSFQGNVLTILLGWIWKITGFSYSNLTDVSFTIPYCQTGKTRIDYFVPNNVNGFTRIIGEETLGIAQAPQLPIHGLYVTFFIVTDSSVGVPQSPNINKTPSIQEVTNIGYSTTNPIWFFNSQNSKCIGLTSERILFQKNESVFNELRSDNTTESYNTQLPNKIGGQEETIAMVSDLEAKLDIADYNDRFKGVHLTESALNIAHPTANSGDSAQVNEVGTTDVVNYSWDAEESIWVKTGATSSGATNTDLLPEGSSNLYFTTARVLATLLSGFSIVTGGSIVSTDSVITAFGKLQKQMSDVSLTIYWDKIGNNIRNNNIGDIELKSNAKVSFLDSSNVETSKIVGGSFISKKSNTGFLGYDEGSGMVFDGSRLIFRAYGDSEFRFEPMSLNAINHLNSPVRNIISFNNSTINPTSGSVIFNLFNISPTVNQTGGADGITRSIYINPTLTNAFDYRAIEVTAGDTRLQKVIVNNVIRLKNYTVATLPTGTQGDSAYVTDVLAPTYLGTLTGGGTVKCPVFFNGTSWVSH